MSREPSIQSHRKRLAAWLLEWRIDQALREKNEAATDTIGMAVQDLATSAPRHGEIRLWPAQASDDPPCYALLLAGDGPAPWRALPFSRFSRPASPDEFRIRGKPPCQVLQAWNERRLTDRRAGQSWRVGMLGPAGLARLQAWLEALATGGDLREELARHCGPPLPHPLDPRHQYQEEDWERVGRALEDALATASQARPLLRFEDARERAWTHCLPVVGKLAAGQAFHGFDADGLEEVSDLPWVDVPTRLAGPRRFVVQVAGDSMEPTLRKGALAVFEYHRSPRRDGEIVIANLQAYGGEVGTETIKRLRATPTHWLFVPDNPDHPTLEVPREELPYPILGTFLGVLDGAT